MASEAQVVANRSNAQKSTGPRTPEGKAVVSQNAVRHGLLAQQAVIKGEDPAEFEFHREQMLAELVPAGAMESVLAERIVGLTWRLRRAERMQNEAIDALLATDARPISKLVRSLMPKGTHRPEDDPDWAETALGRVVASDFANARTLDRLGLYERRIEHSLYRTMAEFQKLRLLRELNPPEGEPTPEPACTDSELGDEKADVAVPVAPDVARRQAEPVERERIYGKQSQFAGAGLPGWAVRGLRKDLPASGPAGILSHSINVAETEC